MATIPPKELAYQKAHPDENNAGNLPPYAIVLAVVAVTAVVLRLWSRKIAKIPWLSDDYVLVFATITTVANMVCYCLFEKFGFGHHYFSLPHAQQVRYSKTGYAANILYTFAYPPSRIALVLLYRRIFVQRWFHAVCWLLISFYGMYMTATLFLDIFLTYPVNARWDKTVKPIRTVDQQKLYFANAGFNITTDVILIILPLTVIWRLSMTTIHKLGLTAIFCVGALTIVASIMRLVYFLRINQLDITYTLHNIVYWTAAELFLGIMCPCLVTFRPLIRSGYLVFSSRFSRHSTGVERVNAWPDKQDGSPSTGSVLNNGSSHSHLANNPAYDDHELVNMPPPVPHAFSTTDTPSALEEGRSPHLLNFAPAPGTAISSTSNTIPKDKHGMALDQETALASLDPRSEARDVGNNRGNIMGTRTEVSHDSPTWEEREDGEKEEGEHFGDAGQDRGITVQRDWRLEEGKR